MRYLPDDSSDEFWGQLKPTIEAVLKETAVLRSWSGRLCHPGQLRFVASNARDKYGNPLFPDLPNEGYLAPDYTYNDFQLLNGLGTRKLNITDFLDRLQADLGRPNSKMKALLTEPDWHSRVASVLSACSEEHTIRVRSLPLIPLVDRSWVSVPHGIFGQRIYFPTSGSCEIPRDLGYRLVDPYAIKNDARKQLFAHLGITDCDPESVISAIHQKHAKIADVSAFDTKPHLQFLFCNLPADSRLNRVFKLATEGGGTVDLSCERAYFPDSKDMYDPKNVFQPQDTSLQRYPAKFILNAYLWSLSDSSASHGMSLSVWLEKVAGVKRIPQIHPTGFGSYSPELDYILRHRSEIVLGLLKKNWSHYDGVITSHTEYRLKECKVPSLSGSAIQLQGSYMPLPRLKSLAERCGVPKASFFVLPPSNLKDEDEESWKFLSRFGVRFVDDADFYMKLLDSIADINEGTLSPEAEQATFRVYNGIMQKCVTKEDCSRVL